MKKIILASGSPRRKQLLEQLGLSFTVEENTYNEDMTAKGDPYELAKYLALKKGEDVAKRHKNAIIISADTFIVNNGNLLGKPKDNEHAKQILQGLSGKEHYVLTGYALIDTANNKIINEVAATKIVFRILEEEEIDMYLATGEAVDKAGAYAIQGKGAIFVDHIEGDYNTIVGLPLIKIYEGLRQLGINPLTHSDN